MDLAYEKSLLMIKFLGIKLTKKQYNKLAVRFDLLSSESLQYITKNNFNYIIKKNIKMQICAFLVQVELVNHIIQNFKF